MLKKWTTLAALVLATALLLTGCVQGGDAVDPNAEPTATLAPLTEPMYTDREALYQYYNAVTFDETLTSLTEKYGEPVKEEGESGDSYSWVMEDGYGFAAAFFDSGRLRAKVLYYKDLRQLGEISNATSIDQFAVLNKNYTYAMTCGALGGRAMELAQIAQDTSDNPEIKRLYVWATPKGDVVQVLFSGDEKLESVSYTLAEGE
ncbi:MAG: hypothetical protein PUD68_06450 [Clostridiales bacterium]|nr:hypothetical protein [Clostridiales bacterium]MDD6872460.1 hypothetical protein [Clostridiales bacterium]MDD7366642.1 hypothetical protein [Clostridiales bacterium]MDY2872005.1 hypothetical protein [Eubacteriales bacterium]